MSNIVFVSEQGVVIPETLKTEALSIQEQLYSVLVAYEGKGFKLDPGVKFFYMNPNYGGHQYDMPEVGLKIHIAIDWQDTHYLDIIRHIAKVCSRRTRLDDVTKFKVMYPIEQATLVPTHTQRYKGVTIYPTYLSGDENDTNVAETVQIATSLQSGLMDFTELQPRKIQNELQVGNGIFVRPGPFSREAEEAELASSDYHLSFVQQLDRLRDRVAPQLSQNVRKQLQEVGWLK